ncbi:hypothetical protein AU381_24800 [Sinorhizobium glycinis]|uniref:Uncharacterized protein n=1 Tax=Sinorhizobium glycinis TaxID=1472378 RepID=A0A178XH34_9HYPH|nr:M10 family metallopeptidase C-terminal domain-containing protein [Sinorhizobium glycinis]OAP34548.1 hypothetical protein AU381_24800 [Sinorhizobium glycinis]
MTVNVISGANTTQINATIDTNQWLLAEGATLAVNGSAFNAIGDADHRVIQINGQVIADASGDGVTLGNPDDVSQAKQNTVTIGKTGSIAADDTGVEFYASSSQLNNHGQIAAAYGLYGSGTNTQIVNTGSIAAMHTGIYVDGSGTNIENYGVVSGSQSAAVVLIGGNANVVNEGMLSSKAMTSTMLLLGGSNFVANGGVISNPNYTAVRFDSSAGVSNELQNSGLIRSGGANVSAISGGDGVELVYNSGRIEGAVVLGAGDDLYDGRGGEITGEVAGGLGDDTYVVDDASIALVETAAGGFDTVRSTVSFALGSEIEILTLIGSGNTDGIGNELTNSLTGNAGDNRLYGEEGDDLLEGGRGADRLSGGEGTDLATYAHAASRVVVDLTKGTASGGEAEGDTLISIEQLIGSGYDDTLVGNAAANSLRGWNGNDTLEGRGGADTLTGDDGLDTASYAASAAAVTVNLTANTASGGDATGDVLYDIENLTGSAFNDALTGSAAANVLKGGNGNDTLEGRGGADVLNGGAGIDTARYAASAAGVTVNLATNTASGGDAAGDQFVAIENLLGSAFNDVLTGSAAANVLKGGNGNDTLEGRGGADLLDGGAGIDTASYAASAAAVTVNLTANTASGGDAAGDKFAGIENLLGSAFNDLFTGSAAANTLKGGNGNDTLEGRGGADLLDGGAGVDTASYAASTAGVTVDLTANTASGGDAAGDKFSSIENLKGSGFADKLLGSAGGNRLWGGAGDDTIDGRAGNDSLTGDAGNDKLIGGAGLDTLFGGTGNDVLTGGADKDVFVFKTGSQADRIADFLDGTDKIDLAGFDAITDFADLKANHAVQSGGAVVISYGTDKLTIDNFTLAKMDVSDFLF